MHERNRHRALAHGRSAPFYRAVPDVACGEKAGSARFQIERRALQWPVIRILAALSQVRPSHEVAVGVTANSNISGPVGLRLAAQTQEEPARVESFFFTRLIVPDCDSSQHMIAVQSDHFGFRHYFNVRS